VLFLVNENGLSILFLIHILIFFILQIIKVKSKNFATQKETKIFVDKNKIKNKYKKKN